MNFVITMTVIVDDESEDLAEMQILTTLDNAGLSADILETRKIEEDQDETNQ